MPQRTTRSTKSATFTALIVVSLLWLPSCGPALFREPVSKFQDASSVVISTTRLYLTELNKVERNNYLLTQAGKGAPIRLAEVQAVQVFGQDGIKARLDALDQLAKYGDLLSKLANSDAPEKIRAQAVDLGEALKNLSKTTDQLTGEDNKKFQSAVGPVTAIVGEILDLITGQKLEQALNKAIRNGEAPVNNLLAVIRSDLDLAYQRKRSFLSSLRVTLVDQYNGEAGKGAAADRAKLQAYAEQIRLSEDQWEIFASANPGGGLDAMQTAHSALVKYAKSGRRVADLASLVEAMETFEARAKRVGEAVQALKKL